MTDESFPLGAGYEAGVVAVAGTLTGRWDHTKPNETTNIRLRAVRFATRAHEGQTRKYTGEPYIIHPLMVALHVANYTHDDEVIAAAVLHDVVEDCGVGVNELHGLFGARVANLVWWLTDQHPPGNGMNRAARKDAEAVRLSFAPPEAQLIKAIDLKDNLPSIVEHAPSFADTYLREKQKLIFMLKAVPDDVRRDAYRMISDAFTQLRNASARA